MPRMITNPNNALKAVAKDPSALERISPDILTEEMILAAVKIDGTSLQYVPRDKRNLEACFKAVHTDGEAIKYVPECLLHYEIIKASIFNSKKKVPAIKYLSNKSVLLKMESKQREEIYLGSVKLDGLCLEGIDRQHRTEEVCRAAVAQNGLALQFVSTKISGYGVSIPFIQDRELQLCAVRQNGLALYYMPRDARDIEICLEALKSRPGAIAFIPAKYLDVAHEVEHLEELLRADEREEETPGMR